jgi:hypothetical protein
MGTHLAAAAFTAQNYASDKQRRSEGCAGYNHQPAMSMQHTWLHDQQHTANM